jgi:hypothetical protein
LANRRIILHGLRRYAVIVQMLSRGSMMHDGSLDAGALLPAKPYREIDPAEMIPHCSAIFITRYLYVVPF